MTRFRFRIPKDVLEQLLASVTPEITTKIIDGQHVKIVPLTEEMIEAAMFSSEAIHVIAQAKGLHEWFQSTPAQRKAGMMGQIAVALYLYGEWTMAFKHAKFREADDGDIQLGHFIINVITNAQVYPVNLAVIDCERFELNPFPLYIACSKLDDKIIIWGYARWDEVATWKRGYLGEGHGESYQKLHSELHEIDYLKAIFKAHLKPT